jgi:hypothetical protein
MGSPAESFEKKNIFFKNSDEIRRLDGIPQYKKSKLFLIAACSN